MRSYERPAPHAMVLLAIWVVLASTSVVGQTEGRTPADLIRYLTYQSDRPDKHGVRIGVFSCGPYLAESRDNGAIAGSLAKFGSSAIPAIETALDLFESRGAQSAVAFNIDWLLLVYARIKGPESYPRLRRMYRKPKLADYAIALDDAVALAFGFTSYVSAFRGISMRGYHQCTVSNSTAVSLGPKPCVPPSSEIPNSVYMLRCDRGDEPKDALNRLIQAWETNDRTSLEASLGPRAKSALDQLLAGKKWTTLRSEFWPRRAGHVFGTGYRFNVPGRWSEPDETLGEREREEATFEESPTPEIETRFKSFTGDDCGGLRLEFVQNPRSSFTGVFGRVEYSVDNDNLGELLRLIVTCATNAPKRQ